MLWGLPGMFLSVPVIAMAKIICDRVQPLKPWAIILGHEKEEKKVLKFPRKKMKKPAQNYSIITYQYLKCKLYLNLLYLFFSTFHNLHLLPL